MTRRKKVCEKCRNWIFEDDLYGVELGSCLEGCSGGFTYAKDWCDDKFQEVDE